MEKASEANPKQVAKSTWSQSGKHWTATTVLAAVAVSMSGWTAYTNWTRPPSAFPTPVVENHISMPTVDGAPGQADPGANTNGSACSDRINDEGAGWGPSRALFFDEAPPPYLTLNSQVDGPLGDERNFYSVRAEGGSEWVNRIDVEEGRLYELRIMVRPFGPKVALTDLESLTVSAVMATCAGYQIHSNAFIESGRSFPDSVWGGVTFQSTRLFNLAVERDSAVVQALPNAPGLPIDGYSLYSASGIDVIKVVGGGEQLGDGAMVFVKVRPQFAAE